MRTCTHLEHPVTPLHFFVHDLGRSNEFPVTIIDMSTYMFANTPLFVDNAQLGHKSSPYQPWERHPVGDHKETVLSWLADNLALLSHQLQEMDNNCQTLCSMRNKEDIRQHLYEHIKGFSPEWCISTISLLYHA